VNRFKTPIGRDHPVERIVLIPGGGGVFDVRRDGEVVFSKHRAGRHANPDEVLEALAQ
jgi:predicted Rdx family selenoprotein